MHHQTTLRVRQLVHEAFQELGLQPETEPHESMLIRGGYFCGRRFTSNELHAVWFFEDNQVKIYDNNGSVSKVFDLTDGAVKVRAQAA